MKRILRTDSEVSLCREDGKVNALNTALTGDTLFICNMFVT